jgi:hypothetical protein
MVWSRSTYWHVLRMSPRMRWHCRNPYSVTHSRPARFRLVTSLNMTRRIDSIRFISDTFIYPHAENYHRKQYTTNSIGNPLCVSSRFRWLTMSARAMWRWLTLPMSDMASMGKLTSAVEYRQQYVPSFIGKSIQQNLCCDRRVVKKHML